MKKSLFLLAGALALFSCSKSEKNAEKDGFVVVTANDFESLDGYFELPASVNKERAHSGKYSIKVDKDIEFSQGFQKPLGQITNRRPKQFALSAFAYVPSKETGSATLVLSLTDPTNNEQVLYKEIKMDQVSAFKEWVPIEEVIDLPENAGFNNLLKIYIWRAGAMEPVYLDDLKLSVKY